MLYTKYQIAELYGNLMINLVSVLVYLLCIYIYLFVIHYYLCIDLLLTFLYSLMME